MNNDVKKVAAIHDISGIGRCSLTATISVLSVMGLQCCPLPTAVLSNQTGFKSYSFLDFTDYMPEYIDYWEKLDVEFDTIYSGFLGSEAQIDIVIDFIKRFRRPQTLIIIDPVFGDNGVVYPAFSQSISGHMKRLISYADIVVPNLTEAAFLTDYKGNPLLASKEDIAEMARKIFARGPKKVVITGCVNGDTIINYIFDFENNETREINAEYNHCSYSGTGDIFASIVCGSLTNGEELEAAVRKASAFVEKAVKYTDGFNGCANDGIFYEKFLKELY